MSPSIYQIPIGIRGEPELYAITGYFDQSQRASAYVVVLNKSMQLGASSSSRLQLAGTKRTTRTRENGRQREREREREGERGTREPGNLDCLLSALSSWFTWRHGRASHIPCAVGIGPFYLCIMLHVRRKFQEINKHCAKDNFSRNPI